MPSEAEPPQAAAAPGSRRERWAARARGWSPATRGLLWSIAAGALFSLLNALMRALTQQVDPFQSQFLRYLFGLAVLLPLVARQGLSAWWPRHMGGQFARGIVHTVGLAL